MIRVERLEKRFMLHLQGGVELPVLAGLSLAVEPGECVALHGPSGAGKSTVLKCIYGTYRASGGSVRVRHRGAWQEVTTAMPREIVAMRRETVGYVSQFLRVIPRVPAARIVADDADAARAMLARLGIAPRLAELPPATFSGGEQQRVNLARAFVRPRPVLLLDEPTAALDASNRAVVVELIREARDRGTAILGIFHDEAVRAAVATRVIRMEAA